MTPALPLLMTVAGLARFTAAQVEDDIDLTIATVGLTATNFVMAPSLTALPGEMRRIDTLSGSVVGDNIVHLVLRDEEPVAYSLRGFGLYLADGTLFAVYGQAASILEKSPLSTTLLAIDVAFPTASVAGLTFGDANFLNPPATTTTKGVVELATLAEGEAGDQARVTTGAVVRNMIDNALAMVVDAIDGLLARTIHGGGLVKGGGTLAASRTLTVDAASAAQIRAGTAGDVALTPAGFAAAGGLLVVETGTGANGARYRRFSDGRIECEGVTVLAAGTTTTVLLPIAHVEYVVPVGSGNRPVDESSNIGVTGAQLDRFTVRNPHAQPITFYWHTRGR